MKRVKSLPVWGLMLVLTVALLAFGASRSGGPSTAAERIDGISKRLACPTCSGESVYVSRASAAESIRNEIARQVSAGQRSDNEIVSYIEDRFPGSLLLPPAEGVDSLVWVLPVVALVCGFGGLVVVFRRWKREGAVEATDDDVAVVSSALREFDDPTDDDNI
ncbi:MAG: cytochrome c biosis protein CcmH [Actinomycetota bacterium]